MVNLVFHSPLLPLTFAFGGGGGGGGGGGRGREAQAYMEETDGERLP